MGQAVTPTEKTSPRKPGRPRKYRPGRINATVRFTAETYAALRAEAEKQGRSMSEEVEFRIEFSFVQGESIRHLLSHIKDLKSEKEGVEEAVERAVERAIARAFAKMGEVK
jgi:hypothetical protein